MRQPTHYVYTLIDPRNGQIFYIGKGKGDRIDFHERELINKGRLPCNQKLERKIKKIWAANLQIGKLKVFHGSEAACLKREVVLIATIGLPNLCNLTHGGVGGDAISRRYAEDPLLRAKLIKAQAGKWTPARRKAFGAKIRELYRTSPAYRKALSRRSVKMWSKPENRLRQKLAFKHYWADPKNRKRQRLNSIRNWKNATIRKRRIDGFARALIKNPNWIKDRNNKIRAYWAKPENRRNHYRNRNKALK